jgi:hypothetical protein
MLRLEVICWFVGLYQDIRGVGNPVATHFRRILLPFQDVSVEEDFDSSMFGWSDKRERKYVYISTTMCS